MPFARLFSASAAIISVTVPLPAFAHGATAAGGLASGLVHPILGLDHLLATIAVGLWAARLGGPARAALPLVFLLAMLAGAVAGIGGSPAPTLDIGIAGSVLLLGLLTALAPRLPLPLTLSVTMLFALLHGHVHGVEMPAGASAVAYGAGFLLATAMLVGTGLLAGATLRRHAAGFPLPAGGAAVAMAGAWLLAVS